MATLAGQIPLAIPSCNEIFNTGSKVFVGLLENCALEPPLLDITLGVAVAISDETADMQITSANATEFTLKQGTILTFPSGTITVADDTVINDTADVSVPIEPAIGIIPISEVANLWLIYPVLSPTDIPINVGSNTVDRQDLNTSQGQEVKTRTMIDSAITCIAQPDDEAIWRAAFPSANSLVDAYLVIVKSSTQTVFGRAILDTYTSASPIDEIERPSFNAKFQGEDYRGTTAWAYLNTNDQGVVNDVLQNLGIAPFA